MVWDIALKPARMRDVPSLREPHGQLPLTFDSLTQCFGAAGCLLLQHCCEEGNLFSTDTVIPAVSPLLSSHLPASRTDSAPPFPVESFDGRRGFTTTVKVPLVTFRLLFPFIYFSPLFILDPRRRCRLFSSCVQ